MICGLKFVSKVVVESIRFEGKGYNMPTLATTVDGLKLPNPFVIASGPPGTNLNVISHAFREGWGAVIAKTVSLDSSKVINVTPRYAKLLANDPKDVIGWENIELISDRKFEIWLDEFKRCKDMHPDGVLIASIMEEYNRDAWSEIVERCQDAGVDSFELNFSCPHGLPERKMGAAMGENPEIVEEVCGWVMAAAKKPVWAKMTPNVTRITDPSRAAFRGGCQGVSAINTIRSVMGVNLDTLRPEPTVEGFTTPGGYSSKAVRPIALRMVMEIATMIRTRISRTQSLRHRRNRKRRRRRAIHPARRGHRAGLHRRDEVRLRIGETDVRRAARLHGEAQIRNAGRFQRQESRLFHHARGAGADARRAQGERQSRCGKQRRRKMMRADSEWSGDDFVKQSEALAR